ncbi:energy transducer TonB, partial [Stenotrophomonas maltophilia]
APPVPPREVATGPLQQQQQRQAPKPALREQPEAPVQPQGDLPPPRTPEPTPSPDVADANVAQTSAPPQVAADAAARYTAPQTTAGERSRAEASWEGRLLGHLQKHRRYPRQAERLRQQGVVYVRFAVARDGAVSGLKLGRSSGFALLDQETLDTVQRASPVPAPPAEVAGDPVDVMVPVSFFLRGR